MDCAGPAFRCPVMEMNMSIRGVAGQRSHGVLLPIIVRCHRNVTSRGSRFVGAGRFDGHSNLVGLSEESCVLGKHLLLVRMKRGGF